MKILSLSLSFLFYIISFSQTIDIDSFASGLDKPVNIQNAGDDRLFVLELDGYIRIIESDGTLVPTPFLDIDNKVVEISGISEQGLLGLAFHPNYASNGYFYVNYINNNGDTVISRFTRSTVSSADPNSELLLLTVDQPFTNHNGGYLAFGADGYLYISLGDGGSGGDPQDNGQDLSTLLGKILRIDVNSTSGSLNYGIPSDNPFLSDEAARDEIWAYGLRNPWRFSFDATTNQLWIGDVGQNAIEEINMVDAAEAGINYGWRCYEGSSEFNTTNCPDASTLTFPVADYSHSGTSRCSVTGGSQYRGSDFPTLQGLYFFADYCSAEIGTVNQDGGTFDLEFRDTFAGNNWSTFGVDQNNELYIASVSSGTIFRIIDTGTLSNPESSLPIAKVYPNPVDEYLQLSINNEIMNIDVTLVDILGRKVWSKQLENIDETTIDLSQTPQGFYILRLSTGDKNQTIKILKN